MWILFYDVGSSLKRLGLQGCSWESSRKGRSGRRNSTIASAKSPGRPHNRNSSSYPDATSRRIHRLAPSESGHQRSFFIQPAMVEVVRRAMLNHALPSRRTESASLHRISRQRSFSPKSSQTLDFSLYSPRCFRRQRPSHFHMTTRNESKRSDYAMEVISMLPPLAQVGQPLESEFKIQVRAEPQASSAQIEHLAHGRLFATVTLITGPDDNGSFTIMGPGALVGQRLVDSVRPGSRYDNIIDGSCRSEPNVLGHLSFPNLMIQTLGTYQLRVTLLKLSWPDGSFSPRPGGASVDMMDSEPIIVV